MNTEPSSQTIPITVDKSHLITIGEKLYSESVELIRELVNNAYDADATEVKITIDEDSIVVQDNGTGMDLEGLKQYFLIGSPEKKRHRKSPKFGRDRIGEFGIGKFATLSACDQFEVFTKKGDFCATVTFDKSEWNRTQDKWELPIRIEQADPEGTDGTKVVLKQLKKQFDLEQVKRRLRESVPLKALHFAVYLNGEKVTPKYVAGRHIPFLEGTPHGIVHGEIVILSENLDSAEEAGIAIKVKQVTIKREFFGLESSHANLLRITGEVHADFLPITSDRTNFILDNAEYKSFKEVMERVMGRVKGELNYISDEKENRRVRKAIKEVAEKIEQALLKNLEFCPPGLVPIGKANPLGNQSASLSSEPSISSAANSNLAEPVKQMEKKARKKKPKIKPLTASALVKKFKIGQMGLALLLDHFGAEAPESFTQGEIIHINRDHPLYRRESASRERHIMHVSRLICQEIALMTNPRGPRQAV